MKIVDVGAPAGANKKAKRVGRGSGSGHGKTSCRGHKGAGQRSGTATWAGFEGGQMPLLRRLPKKGFRSRFKKKFQVVNVESLNRFPKDAAVGPAEYKKAGLITTEFLPVKILGGGNLSKALSVTAHGVTRSAIKKMQDAGATFKVITERPMRQRTVKKDQKTDV